MSLENRVFLHEKEVKTPSENLAINKMCSDLIKTNIYDLIARVYYHSNGVILGNAESLFDINEFYCKENGYEIVRRPSGGSVILVDPKLVLCYSIFFDSDKFNLGKDLTRIYKAITIPFARKLGKNITVEGAYYLRLKLNGASIPFAGHAMRFYNQRIVQFDGVVNRKAFDIEILEKALNLRELYTFEGKEYIVVNGKAYNLEGKEINKFDKKRAIFLRDEKRELEKVLGIEEIGLNDEEFVKALYSTLVDVFGKIKIVDEINLNKNDLLKNIKKIKEEVSGGTKTCLGHCFVDLVEKEPRIHYGI